MFIHILSLHYLLFHSLSPEFFVCVFVKMPNKINIQTFPLVTFKQEKKNQQKKVTKTLTFSLRWAL